MTYKVFQLVSTLVAILGAIFVPASMLTAQDSQGALRVSPIPAVNDRPIVDILGPAIVEKSSFLFMRAAREGTQVPLEVTLPSGATSYQWQAFLDHLMLSLRGRSLQTSDKFKYVIDASGITFTRDSIRATIDVGIRSRCHGEWIHDGTSHTLMWVRHGDSDSWKPARDEPPIAYDSFGCPVDPR